MTQFNEIELFDQLLLESLIYLQKHWYDENTGIVTCCLKDRSRKVFATSFKNDTHWLHAERNAYNKYKVLYGNPSKDAVFIVSLSPCINDLKYRKESSCADLIKKIDVKRIHFGVLDTMHAASEKKYKDFGIIGTLSTNEEIKVMSEKLMSLFSIYDSRINSELLDIKRELGDEFFFPIRNHFKT